MIPRYCGAEAARAYLPFGTGPRSCVGQQLALAVATLVLTHMMAEAEEQGVL